MWRRFQILNAISEAAGKIIASSRVSSKRVRSVQRRFVGMVGFVKSVLRQEELKLRIRNIKTCWRPCVKPKQTIVKSCEEKWIALKPLRESRLRMKSKLFSCEGLGLADRSRATSLREPEVPI